MKKYVLRAKDLNGKSKRVACRSADALEKAWSQATASGKFRFIGAEVNGVVVRSLVIRLDGTAAYTPGIIL